MTQTASSATYVAAADAMCDETCLITLHHVGRHTDACSAQWNMVLDALLRADDEPIQGPEPRPADWTDDEPAPRWARVGAALVIAWTVVFVPLAVGHVAADPATWAATATAPVPACGSDAECARYDAARGIFPAPDVTAAPDQMCPAGWDVVGIDDDTVPAACVPAPLIMT